MINKSQFESLENQLDIYAKVRKLNSVPAKQYLDAYFELILSFFKQINEIEFIDLNHLDQYPVVPMNFSERYHYMLKRKYHFMGYSQMKTLKNELIKMNASYQIRKKKNKITINMKEKREDRIHFEFVFPSCPTISNILKLSKTSN